MLATFFKITKEKPWILASIYLLALAVGHIVIALPGNTLLWRSVENSLHIPAFAILALIVWLLQRKPGILIPFVICVSIGATLELMQLFTGRDADVYDLINDTISVSIVLGGVYLYNKQFLSRRKTWLYLAGLCIVIFMSAVPAHVALTYHHRDTIFPSFLDIARWKFDPLIHSNSTVTAVNAPQAWTDFAGKSVLKIEFAEHKYPGIQFEEIVGLWDGYSKLIVEAYISGDTPLILTVAVGYSGIPGTSAYVPTLANPGPIKLEIPLSKLIDSSQNNHPTISHLVIHTSEQFSGRTILLGAVYLAK